MRRLEMENDLREAPTADRVRLHYQPVINLVDGGMAGVEALLRLDHQHAIEGYLREWLDARAHEYLRGSAPRHPNSTRKFP